MKVKIGEYVVVDNTSKVFEVIHIVERIDGTHEYRLNNGATVHENSVQVVKQMLVE